MKFKKNAFVVALWAIVGSVFIPLVARAQSPPEITIEIRADIDGRSQLILRGNTAQWHHFDFAAPGRQLFTNFPTTINGVDWFPVWPDVPNAENRFCNCFSDVFTGVVPPLPAQPIEVGLQILSVVRHDAPGEPAGTVAIVQFPTPENNFTIIVEFDDNPQFGSAFYHVRLRIRTLAITVQIDIKPGSFPNSINLRAGGTLPVAILSSETFDATTVDPITVKLAGAPVKLKPNGRPMASVEHVNADGRLDLVVHVEIVALQLTSADTQAVLEGKTFGGTAIRGTDSVRVLP